MTPWLRGAAWFLFWATLALALLLGAFLAWLLSEVLPPGTVITVDGERFVMPGLTHFGHWLLAIVGVLIAAAVLAVVVPLVLVLATVLPMAIGGLGLALGLAPLVLLGWLLWRLARRWWKPKDKATTIAA